MCAHRYISPQTGQKALFLPSTAARKSCCCRCLSVCVCVCTAHLCKCTLACVCVWNITALTGTAPRRCNWLSERGKQDCSHVEGSWRLTFRKADRRNGRMSASGTSLHWLSSDCSFDTGAIIFTFFFFFLGGSHGGEQQSDPTSNIPITHMEHFEGRTPSSRITGFLVWSGSSMFLPLIRLGSVSCLRRCTLCHWKCDYHTSAEVKARHPLRASKRCQRQGDGVVWAFSQGFLPSLPRGKTSLGGCWHAPDDRLFVELIARCIL